MLNVTSPRITDIPTAKIQLKAHQQAMVKKCLDIEHDIYKQIFLREKAKRENIAVDDISYCPYGVMSAPVGSGKTYCILALCLLDKYPITNSVANEQASLFGYFRRMVLNENIIDSKKVVDENAIKEYQKQMIGASMVVVPSHLFSQWQTAIQAYTNKDFKVNYFENYGDITKLYYNHNIELHDTDLYLVSSLYYQNVATTLQTLKISFRRLIFDEADNMVKFLSYAAPATITWFVSSSIRQIIGEKGLVISNPGVFGEIADGYVVPLKVLETNSVDCDIRFIRQCFDLPMIQNEFKFFDEPIMNGIALVLHDKESSKALFACDPDCVFKKEQKGNLRTTINNSYDLANGLCIGWTSNIDALKQDIEFVRPNGRFTAADAANKITTMRNIIENLQQCVTLLQKLMADNIKVDEFEKIAYIAKLCNENNGKKTLIFSEYPGALLRLEKYLQKDGIEYADFDGGSKEQIAEAINNFNEGKVSIMLIHSTFFSCGTNLEKTDQIIITHEINDELRQQVIGRAQRPGRTGPLLVIDLRYVKEQPAVIPGRHKK